MPTTVRAQVVIDPTEQPSVWIVSHGSATYLDLAGNATVVVAHSIDGHTPEAMIAWFRAVADSVERAWTARRIAEQHKPFEVTEQVAS